MTRTDRLYKAKIGALLVFICVILLVIIGITAYNSKVQYDINSLNTKIGETQKEVQNLQVQIKSAANITNLESRAFALGLIYPGFNSIVYLDGDKNIEDFALALMESAYN